MQFRFRCYRTPVFGTPAEVTLSELALGRQGNGECNWDGGM